MATRYGDDGGCRGPHEEHKLVASTSAAVIVVNNARGESEKLTWKDCIRQILACCMAHSVVIQAGLNMSFSAILLPQLVHEGSIITSNKSAASWIAGLSALSLPLGAVCAGPLMDRFGRKYIAIFSTLPFILAWVLHACANSIWYIYAGRIISGFSSGLTTVCLVYVSELSHTSIRAMLLGANSVFVSLGILINCILGCYLHWKVISVIYAGIVFASFVGLWLLPESPHWLFTIKEDRAAATTSLRWLYSDPKNFGLEFSRLIESRNKPSEAEPLAQKGMLLYKHPTVAKPIAILVIIFLLQQLSGAYVIIFYSVDIFKVIGGDYRNGIDEYVSLVLFGTIRLVMSIISALLSRRVGRRVLLIVSAGGMSVCAVAAGLNVNNGNVALAAVLGYVTFSSLGILVIPWTLVGELLPVKVRGKLSGLMVALAYLFMFVLVKLFPFVLETVSMQVIFGALTAVNLCCVCFVYFCLPETLGRSFKDIEGFFIK